MVPARARRRPGSYGRSLFGASFGRVSKEKKALAIELVEDLGEDRCPRERGPLSRAVVGATVLGMIVALAVMQGGTVTWAKLLGVLGAGSSLSWSVPGRGCWPPAMRAIRGQSEGLASRT